MACVRTTVRPKSGPECPGSNTSSAHPWGDCGSCRPSTCEEAGWTGTVGMIHSHPTGERCWYYFPGTQVPTSDAQSFGRTPYAVDAIMCGAKVVWIGRDTVQREFGLVESVESDGGDRGLRP